MAMRQNFRISKIHKNYFKQTGDRVFAMFIFAILVDFAFKFCYKPLTLCREWYRKYISVKISFSAKIIM